MTETGEILKDIITQAVRRGLHEGVKFAAGKFNVRDQDGEDCFCPISWASYYFSGSASAEPNLAFGSPDCTYSPLLAKQYGLKDEEIWEFIHAFDGDPRSSSEEWREFAKSIKTMIGSENLVFGQKLP